MCWKRVKVTVTGVCIIMKTDKWHVSHTHIHTHTNTLVSIVTQPPGIAVTLHELFIQVQYNLYCMYVCMLYMVHIMKATAVSRLQTAQGILGRVTVWILAMSADKKAENATTKQQLITNPYTTRWMSSLPRWGPLVTRLWRTWSWR